MFALARYNPNGTLDRTFGGDGKVFTNVRNGYDDALAVAIQANGKVVTAGSSEFCDFAGSEECEEDFALARYSGE